MKEITTIEHAANRLIVGTDYLTKGLLAVCIILGVGFILFAITQYQMHRRNPKFVPLDRPILFFILGCLLILIPFLGELIAPTGSTIDYKKQEQKQAAETHWDIDAPLNFGNDFNH